MTLDIRFYSGFFHSLSQISQLTFEIRDADGNLIFPHSQSENESDSAENLALSDRIIAQGTFAYRISKENDSVCGAPIRNGDHIIGTLISQNRHLQATPRLPDGDKAPHLEEMRLFLTDLTDLMQDHLISRIESEELAEELSQTYEELYLYGKIETHGRTLHFSEAMLRDVLDELRTTMRAEMAFTFLPELKEYETLICDEACSEKIFDMNGFIAALVGAIPLDAPTLADHYFIVNDSQEDEAFRKIHPDPYRFLAVAIQKDDTSFGWLCMVSFDMREIFRRAEFWLLKSLASSAAAAFENSRLYTESLRSAEKERLIRHIFQKYVPEAVANEILDRGERDLIKLGEKKLLTLLNVDIRGYSRLSKRFKAEDMVEVLNYFFMVMGSVVLDHNGILDKYLGDGLLAIFGAPVASDNPACDASLAALEMVEKLNIVNTFSREKYGMPIKIGISINTGEAIMGNIGFEKKMDYTVIGDVVNDTFRLQDLTREKSDSIFISESTHKRVCATIKTRFLGLRILNKDEKGMGVYEVIGKMASPDG